MASPLGALFSYFDSLKRNARRNVEDIATSPEDWGKMKAARIQEDMSNRMDDPTAALDFTPVGGLAGMIRRGGARNLNMVHNVDSSLGELADLLKQRGSFSNPSIAIAKDEVFPFAHTPTLVFNPRSPLFDPASHRGNQLYNRDAYTFRGRSPKEVPRYLRQDPTADFRGTEGLNLNDEGQQLAMEASPRFSSFAQYENSRHGARILQPLTEADKEFSRNIADMASGWMAKNQLYGRGDYVQLLRQAAKAGDEEASYILEAARSIPSDYAELKVLGEVPINARNVSAIMLPEYSMSRRVIDQAQRLAEQTGLPVGSPTQLMPQVMLPAYEGVKNNLTNLLYDRFKKTQSGDVAPGDVYGGLSQFARRYLNPSDVDQALWSSGRITDIRNIADYALEHSPGYAADVASIYTAR